jgi:hypothetical protein
MRGHGARKENNRSMRVMIHFKTMAYKSSGAEIGRGRRDIYQSSSPTPKD